MSRVAIDSFGPTRPWGRPGEPVRVAVHLAVTEPVDARLRIVLLDLAGEIAEDLVEVTIGPGSWSHDFEVLLPDLPRRGYGLRLEVDDGHSVHVRTSAVEALGGWWESPRHAAITDYRDASVTGRATADLAKWHVTVVQHYDWMWRHYRYRPPDGATEFADALGRTVSHDAVRAAVEAGHERGIASLAYGSVYGAEPEYVGQHPDERMFGDDGEPLSLGDTFFINDLRPGSAWRDRLLAEYESAVTDFAFEGIHMDTYGPPHTAVAADGEAIDFAALYPGLIEEASERLAAAAPGARVLFDCVEGFPLEAVAPAPAAALYLELWPPDRTFGDVVRWIDLARGLAAGRQVIIAAYAAPLKDPAAVVDRASAFEASVLLGSFIAAAGAYHHTIAEGDRLLVEGYYPAAVQMEDDEVEELRALWEFTARYVHLLSDPGLSDRPAAGLGIETGDGRALPWSTEPEAGALWVRAATMPDGRPVIHFVDLTGQADTDWDAPKRLALTVAGARIFGAGLREPVAACPWERGGEAVRLGRSGDGWELPTFRRWLMVTEAAPR